MIVYKVISPSNKIYIGITRKSLSFRRKEHERTARVESPSSLLHRAIKKYGPTSMIWLVIDTAESWEELCALERMYIIKFNSFGEGGYNLTKGGDGNTGIGLKGSKNGMFGKPSPNRGKTTSDETKQKLRDSWTEDKKRDLAIRRGAQEFEVIKIKSIPAKRKGTYVHKKIIEEYVVGKWLNQNQCARDLGLSSSVFINKCLKGSKKSYKGYIFKYVQRNIDG